MDRLYEPVSKGENIRKLCEELSWIALDWVEKEENLEVGGDVIIVYREKTNHDNPPKECEDPCLKTQKTKEERLKVLLYNAITLLADETFERYDEADEWLFMICDELKTTKEELEEFGVVLGL